MASISSDSSQLAKHPNGKAERNVTFRYVHAGRPAYVTLACFVSCSAYHTFRQHATQSLITETSRILDSADVPLLVCRSFLQVIRRLFEDGPSWPQSLSRFYLGLIPPLPALTGLTGAKTGRLLVRIAHSWHTSCIRLAGRIWAEYRRRVRPAPSKKKNNAVAIELPSFLSHILLS